jgi:hypothetical protein
VERFKPYLVPAVAALIYLGWWLLGPGVEPGATPEAGVTPPAPSSPSTRARDVDADAKLDEPTPSTAGTSPLSRPERRAARDGMLREIETALEARRARGATAAADGEPPADGLLDKDYIQARVREDLLPIATECYEAALEDQPKLAGRLVMQFTIVGDESVGGVVSESEVAEESELQHPALRECIRESIFALTFSPPQGGGTVDVTYPFVFTPDDPDENQHE